MCYSNRQLNYISAGQNIVSVSCCHLSDETRLFLAEQAVNPTNGYAAVCAVGNDAHAVFPLKSNPDPGTLPDDLTAVISYAQDAGVYGLCLSLDGELLSGLPVLSAPF